ncbi:MAG: histidine--tRNA ligase [Bacteroidales bacterium]|nr:histidine--tRNA ligase [Bacteroidales bacterium]MCF8391977.1 histidine--tRNA ligase [Bacteroidales bacterium]
MAASKPAIPKGTRDFGPDDMVKRNYIFETIKKVFRNYGFLSIETPAMENLDTLLGKYGDEGDKLLFRVLNSGDFLSKSDTKVLSEKNSAALSSQICDRGLKYDLTVPFARFVVQHRNDIQFPFKRYQIQPVWRADRPQKGRYREFYQCDVDVIGSNSLLNEAELLSIIDKVFEQLSIKVLIKINNRKVLAGIAEVTGSGDQLTDLTVAIDKLDKIGMEKVKEELLSKGFSQKTIEKVEPILIFEGSFEEKLNFLKKYLSTSAIGLNGIEEIMKVGEYSSKMKIKSEIELDLSLARGLNYYTGAIIEVKALETEIGSICGGGRYDDLTGIFGLPDVSGVGVSFGADRIFDVLQELNRFPEGENARAKLMFVNFGEVEANYILGIIGNIRDAGINAELYPDSAKMKKQMTYADANKIPYVALIGEEEMKNELITLKDMKTGEQVSATLDAIIKKLS